MTAEEAEAILRNTAGNPSSGAVADIIPAMAQAIAAATSTPIESLNLTFVTYICEQLIDAPQAKWPMRRW